MVNCGSVCAKCAHRARKPPKVSARFDRPRISNKRRSRLRNDAGGSKSSAGDGGSPTHPFFSKKGGIAAATGLRVLLALLVFVIGAAGTPDIELGRTGARADDESEVELVAGTDGAAVVVGTPTVCTCRATVGKKNARVINAGKGNKTQAKSSGAKAVRASAAWLVTGHDHPTTTTGGGVADDGSALTGGGGSDDDDGAGAEISAGSALTGGNDDGGDGAEISAGLASTGVPLRGVVGADVGSPPTGANERTGTMG